MGFWWRASTICVCLGICLIGETQAADWKATITDSPPGPFVPPRSLRAAYRFGWAGFTAATAEINFTKLPDSRLRLDGRGRTVGLVRTLWRMDASQIALSDGKTLRPIETRQTEVVRSKKIVTHLTFDAKGVTRSRSEGSNAVPKLKRFEFPNLYDLQSALLYLRSHPLQTRNIQRVVVYPATSAYLATVTVLGREKISVRAGTYDSIKLDLQLNKLGKTGELEQHRKFRRATAWISDDADRLVLRIDAQVFVGTVFAELQSVRFEDAKQ
jgi:hypothetical protein